MNNLCLNLNFNIDLFKPIVDIYQLPKVRLQILDIDTINEELIDFLYSKGIEIRAVELFYSQPDFNGGIHTDGSGDEGDDVTKLNYIFGGANSLMNWYKINPDAKPNVMQTDKGTPYINYSNKDAEKIYTASVGFPSLVQVAVPHSVKNFEEPRYCVCLVIHDAITKKRFPFNYLAELFNEFKV